MDSKTKRRQSRIRHKYSRVTGALSDATCMFRITLLIDCETVRVPIVYEDRRPSGTYQSISQSINIVLMRTI